MADMAEVMTPSNQFKSVKFGGSVRNMVPGVGLVLAGLLAPSMGLTDVYFAQALAWVFVIWGIFFIYVALLDVYESWEVKEDGLAIHDPLRVWERTKEWPWQDIFRVEVVMERKDLRPDDAELRVYYTPPNAGNIEREDRDFDPALTQLIIERAGLKPDNGAPGDLTTLPEGTQATYAWNR